MIIQFNGNANKNGKVIDNITALARITNPLFL